MSTSEVIGERVARIEEALESQKGTIDRLDDKIDTIGRDITEDRVSRADRDSRLKDDLVSAMRSQLLITIETYCNKRHAEIECYPLKEHEEKHTDNFDERHPFIGGWNKLNFSGKIATGVVICMIIAITLLAIQGKVEVWQLRAILGGQHGSISR